MDNCVLKNKAPYRSQCSPGARRKEYKLPAVRNHHGKGHLFKQQWNQFGLRQCYPLFSVDGWKSSALKSQAATNKGRKRRRRCLIGLGPPLPIFPLVQGRNGQRRRIGQTTWSCTCDLVSWTTKQDTDRIFRPKTNDKQILQTIDLCRLEIRDGSDKSASSSSSSSALLS